MSRICIIALIGLPAAGKTMFSQQLLSWAQLPFNVVHFCFDDFLQFDYSNQRLTHFVFKTERSRIIALLHSILVNLKSQNTIQLTSLEHNIPTTSHNSKDYVILCDDNNYYSSMRYKIYQMCKAEKVYYGQIYFPIDLKLSLQRNAQRNIHEQVPQNIIEQMFTRLERPNPKKNFWESVTLNIDFSISFNTQSFPIARVLNFVDDVFQHGLTYAITVDVQVKEQNTSSLHNLDIMLRRRIKEILEDSSFTLESKKNKAKILNLKRKEILQNYNKYTTSDCLCLEHLNDICKVMH